MTLVTSVHRYPFQKLLTFHPESKALVPESPDGTYVQPTNPASPLDFAANTANHSRGGDVSATAS